jgi:flagellar hook-associated protein FlgK
VLNDGLRVATAAQFRVSENANNTSTVRSSVMYSSAQVPVGISNTSLVNNPNPTAGVSIKIDGSKVYSPVTTMAAGMNATFYLDNAAPGQQLQVITRDGRQLLGQTLSETEKFQMMTQANGFVSDATYSDTYLNKSGEKSYRGIDVFYGAKAKVLYSQAFDKNLEAIAPVPQPAVLETARIAATPVAAGTDLIHQDAVTINGVSMGALGAHGLTPMSGSLSPDDVATWINEKTSETGVRAEVFNELHVPVSSLNFTKGLTLNGVNIPATSDVKSLVAAINSTSSDTSTTTGSHVSASVDVKGDLVIVPTTPGAPILLEPIDDGGKPNNLLGLKSTSYTGQVRLVQVADELHITSGNVDYTKPLVINGQTINVSGLSKLTDLAAAINDPALNMQPSVLASVNASGVLVLKAVNQRSITAAGMNYTQPLVFNGKTMDVSGVNNLTDLAAAINAPTSSLQPGVVASINDSGALVLVASSQDSITIGPAKAGDGSYQANALGLEPIAYTVQERLKRLLVEDPSKTDIRVSFGQYGDPPTFGTPADLAKVGIRTGAYLDGGVPDDVLVFVTGQGSASVAASYSGQPADPRDNLRKQSLVVKFTAADRFTITDALTGTELANRHYDASVLEPVIDYQGLQIKFTHAPNVGDVYQVDGNQDGLGNNVNMLAMSDLAKKEVVNGKTLNNSYIDQINSVGNLAQQANITQQALTVVNDQAIASRDKVSGVNLDDEAAALIRYQQAYQASAKALQVSGQLFDAIVQIR